LSLKRLNTSLHDLTLILLLNLNNLGIKLDLNQKLLLNKALEEYVSYNSLDFPLKNSQITSIHNIVLKYKGSVPRAITRLSINKYTNFLQKDYNEFKMSSELKDLLMKKYQKSNMALFNKYITGYDASIWYDSKK
jgi:hypothetical protein